MMETNGIELIAMGLSFLIGILIGLRVRGYSVFKAKLMKLEKVIEELLDVVRVLNKALKDDRVSKEEVQAVLKEARELISVIRELLRGDNNDGSQGKRT